MAFSVQGSEFRVQGSGLKAFNPEPNFSRNICSIVSNSFDMGFVELVSTRI
jgi:hypothetical protein